MRITNIKLVNCGLHEQLEMSSDGPIVGVCGSNGSGKSTVLEMLRYALTGETSENIDTYVRQGSSNGSVELSFRKNGQEHSIFRQFGKSPRRSFRSGTNSPLTKVKEIDTFLADLLGADRLAMNSAIFIGQGHLESLLFRGDADRRSLFIKLVNLGFCGSRSDAAAQIANEVGQQISNIEPVLAAAEELVKTRETELAKVLTDTADVRDWSPEMTQLGAYQRLCGQREELTRQLQQSDQLVTLRKQNLEERFPALREDPNYYAKRCRENEELQACRRGLSELLQRRSRLSEEKNRYGRLAEEQRRLSEAITVDEAALEVLPSEQILHTRVGEIVCQIEQRKRNESARCRLQLLPDELLKAKASLEVVKRTLEESDAWLVQKRSELTNVVESLRLANERLVFGGELRRCFQTEGKVKRATCPKCSLTVVDIEIPTEVELAGLSENAVRVDHQKKLLVQGISERETSVRKLTVELSGWERRIETLHEELRQLQGILEEEATSSTAGQSLSLEQELSLVRANLSKRISTISRVRQNQDARKAVMLEQLKLNAWRSEDPAALEPGALTTLGGQLRALDEQLRTDGSALQDMAAHLSSHQAAVDQLENLRTQLQVVEAKLGEELLPDLARLLKELPSASAAGAFIEDGQRQWNEAVNTKTVAEASLQAARQQVVELRIRLDQDKDRRALMKDLGTIRELFSESGLPATVVSHYFRRLGYIAQRHLNNLNANFRIELDSHRPFTFCFERLDRSDGVLPMSKLSGGQKVRLCLAFLMAVQEVLVPNVGLLVLDEVSDSLDEEGVSSLAELLRGMAGQLQNSDHQLWVVDHRAEIAGALPLKLSL